MSRVFERVGLILMLTFTVLIVLSNCATNSVPDDSGEPYLTYEVDPTSRTLKMYWQNEDGENYRNAENLKNALEKKGEKLLFAVNGGMYNDKGAPQGLYIENGKTLAQLDTATKGYGNFYLQPNGVFYLTNHQKPMISTTSNFSLATEVQFATQSGPMLLIEGKINSLFGKDSESLNYRNGVGILPNGNAFFVQSKQKVNFYEFAKVFADKGCEDALYLDGYVSQTYLPEKKWEQLDGDFGVMIAVTE
jgi:uncharacterized protein YigE (DUF2233 family)